MKKLRIPKALKSKRVVLAIVASTLVATAGVSAYTVNQTSTASEETPIVKEVNRQGEQLDNHEGRITNAESDIGALQQNTGTAPSTTRVEVSPTPAPSTQISAPVAKPTVVSYSKIVIDTNNTDCKYAYSDGTVYQWRWQTINPQGSWVTDGNGNNGHWVATTNTTGNCSATAIGGPKVN